MSDFYRTIGVSKQAVYQHNERHALYDQRVMALKEEVDQLRKAHPGCGVEKMYYGLQPSFIGRDKFVSLFMNMGYRLKRHKNYKRTTTRGPVHYPNCIKGLQINAPSQVWQSDITYIQVNNRFYYAVFILDVYTRKIVGYKVSEHMRTSANLSALKMALDGHSAPYIHHSDHGSQYGSRDYLAVLKVNNCRISMSNSGQDNAYAERINRTIKEEYLQHKTLRSFEHLKDTVQKAVSNYNTIRPHRSLGMISPVRFQERWELLSLENRPVLTIFNNQKNH
ncbi:IS3 family transposase [Pedobacter sp. SYP-B3415]|uniref:IS3 family transposase n=1 Tax=Pedobacter sp. SYP-B3415 TaxID=2496641 RepID=UPI00101D7E60|nr:IS3 family transposase [Pedobacter sp. SYP-B3415]